MSRLTSTDFEVQKHLLRGEYMSEEGLIVAEFMKSGLGDEQRLKVILSRSSWRLESWGGTGDLASTATLMKLRHRDSRNRVLRSMAGVSGSRFQLASLKDERSKPW